MSMFDDLILNIPVSARTALLDHAVRTEVEIKGAEPRHFEDGLRAMTEDDSLEYLADMAFVAECAAREVRLIQNSHDRVQTFDTITSACTRFEAHAARALDCGVLDEDQIEEIMRSAPVAFNAWFYMSRIFDLHPNRDSWNEYVNAVLRGVPDHLGLFTWSTQP